MCKLTKNLHFSHLTYNYVLNLNVLRYTLIIYNVYYAYMFFIT